MTNPFSFPELAHTCCEQPLMCISFKMLNYINTMVRLDFCVEVLIFCLYFRNITTLLSQYYDFILVHLFL